ncbi:cobalamin biosynthesis protein CbiX [Oxalicibacterium flavum]|uniref:Cobalamin biosynthesis protein CbiX n=1 Tax=Oxalicibacterium flavum TaxID=179467 RepID=A0A8J2UJP4_9BURK|nr:CbiX/SirB N-terminal domain-containing protein [Oxalicibacterium flavum]GGB95080.1 cobalamin biosynthesis protein CbiX [Oxalicibacterium flavum]
MATRALVLFAHGARDPRWAEPFQRLQDLIQRQSPDVTVVLGFLELMSPRLPELAEQLAQQGVSDITVVPVFLGQGGHVMRDLPGIVEELRQVYPQMGFRIAGAVGEDASVLDAMAAYCLRTLS